MFVIYSRCNVDGRGFRKCVRRGMGVGNLASVLVVNVVKLPGRGV